MKDIDSLHYCLGIKVRRDRWNRMLWISEMKYVGDMLELFRIDRSTPMNILSQVRVLLYNGMSPRSKQEEAKMERVSYSNVVGKFMYTTLCPCNGIYE
jgi:hypothetical protein